MGLFDKLTGRGGPGKTAEERRLEKLRSMMPSASAAPTEEKPTEKNPVLQQAESMPPADSQSLAEQSANGEANMALEEQLYAMPKLKIMQSTEDESSSTGENRLSAEEPGEETVQVRFFDWQENTVKETEEGASVEEAPVVLPTTPKNQPSEKPQEKKPGRFGFLFKKTEKSEKAPVVEEVAPMLQPETEVAPCEVGEDIRSDMERLADQIQVRYPTGIKSLYALQNDMQFCVEISRVIRSQKDREELKNLLRERKLLQTEQGEQGETDGVTEVTAELFEQFMNRLVDENQGMLFSYTQVVDNVFFQKTLALYEDFCLTTYQQPLEDYLIWRRKLAANREKLTELALLPEFTLFAPGDTLLERYAKQKALPFEVQNSAEGHLRHFHKVVNLVETEKGNNCYACLKLRFFEGVTLLREPEGRVAVYNCDNELCGYIEEAEQQWIYTAMSFEKITMPAPVVVEHVFTSDEGKFRRKTTVALYFHITFDERRFVLYGETPFERPRYFALAPKEERSPEGYYIMNLDNTPETVELTTRRVEGVNLRTCDHITDWDYTLRPDGTVVLKNYTGAQTKLTLPATIDGHPVVELAKDAMSGNAVLVSVRIPGSITLIRENAFRSCSVLESVSIGEGCDTVERHAFADCPQLRRVTAPASLCHLTDGTPFANTPWRDETREEYLMLGSVLLSWQGKKLAMRIPGGVKSFARGAAAGNPLVTQVIFPDGMTEISEQAFYPSNKKLETIAVPLSVRRIGENAFRGTKWLTDHTDDFLVVNDLLLRYRGADKTVHLPSDIHVICEGAFQGCGIERLWMEDSLTHIGDNAFRQCENLRSVSVGSGLRVIGNSAFALCRNLTEFYLPEKMESIGERAFWGCSMLEDVRFPQRLLNQGKDAFVGTPHILKYGNFAVSAGRLVKYMGNAAAVQIPEGVIEIAPRTFAGLRNLVSVELPQSLQSIDREAFADCVCLYEITGGANVATIGNAAFRGCRSLRKFPFPAKLRTIGEQAFFQTDLQQLTMPKELESIGVGAFGGKAELTVYDSINPGSQKAEKCSLACAMLTTGDGETLFDADTTVFAPIRITMKSALSGSAKYSFYFDGRGESRAYQEFMLCCWGKKGEIDWAGFDGVFMKIRNQKTRLINAYDRLKNSPSPDEDKKAFYQTYLRRILLIPESYQMVSDYMMENDDKNLLALLQKLGAVTEEQQELLRQLAVEKGAEKCAKALTKY